MKTENVLSACASQPDIVLVTIVKNGSDRGVFVGGTWVLVADPSCGDDVNLVSMVAHNLSLALGSPVREVALSPEDNWSWDDIACMLSSASSAH